MTKPIVMVAPVDQTFITADDPMADRGRWGALSKSAMDGGDEVLKKHPEATALIMLLYTPRGPTDPVGSIHAYTHSSVCTNNSMDIEAFKDFLDKAIPSLLKLRFEIEQDPDYFEDIAGNQLRKQN